MVITQTFVSSAGMNLQDTNEGLFAKRALPDAMAHNRRFVTQMIRVRGRLNNITANGTWLATVHNKY